MDRDERLVGRVVAIEHDFPDQDMSDPLLGAGIRAWRIPGRRQITGKRDQRRAVDLRAKRRRDIMSGDAVLEMGDLLQRRVPARLELARDQTLGGVDDLVAAGRQGSSITRFLELPAERLPDLVVSLHREIGGLDCGVDGLFRDGLDDLRSDGAIDPDTADADAQPSADVTVVAAAMIAVGMARLRAIEHPHRPAATAAAHQSGQQGSTAASRLPLGAPLHMRVLRDQLLVRFVLFPADVPGMVIAQQDVPRSHRLRLAPSFAGAPVDNARPLGCAAVDIGTSIDRMSTIKVSTVW